jgi:hypothetical protein
MDRSVGDVAKLALAAAAVLGLHGCSYQIPIKEGEPTATVRFVDPRSASGGRALTQAPTKITQLDESGCAELGHVAGLGSFNNYRMELTVPARKTLFFRWFNTAPAFRGMWACEAVYGFSLEAGQLYEARFDLDLNKKVCDVELLKISQASGGAAGNARVPMSSPAACKGKP